MTLRQLQKKNIPAEPGVYVFKKRKQILYIGRASNLKNRVRSYFDKNIVHSRGPLIEKMVADASTIETIPTDSVLEAVFLEAHLIKKHQPAANTREKSNKSFAAIVITKEDFPRVLVVRERDIATGKFDENNIAHQYGPFMSKNVAGDALRILRRILPFRDSTCMPSQGKPCFNRQLGLCPGVCTGEISKTEYRRTIRTLRHIFEGKKGKAVRVLQKRMKELAEKQKFEEAEDMKRKIAALEHIQDVSLMKREVLGAHQGKRIEAYDVAHISGESHVGVMVVVEGGELDKNGYRKFSIKSVSGANDTAALREILSRRFNHPEWIYPKIIVVDGGKAQMNTAEKVLHEYGMSIPVVAVTKDEFHRPKKLQGDSMTVRKHEDEILLANNEAHRFAVAFHRQKSRKRMR